MPTTTLQRIYLIVALASLVVMLTTQSFSPAGSLASNGVYKNFFRSQLDTFRTAAEDLKQLIVRGNMESSKDKIAIKHQIAATRIKLKSIDLWLRYLEPTTYLKLNGPLPVEWENEVFEKFEQPYRREGAGLTLAELYLDENNTGKDSLLSLVDQAIVAVAIYGNDSITVNLDRYHHFFLANRLFLLNLASIYTTGFECPGSENIIPELQAMLGAVKNVYSAYDQSFPGYPIRDRYLKLYDGAISFVTKQPRDANAFDHFSFIRDYVNPLFALNQAMIRDYGVTSINFNDYTLNNNSVSIFDKSLYEGQNVKGIYLPVEDEATLAEIKKTGKLLFYDPILSGNNKRSCASCHKSGQYFTDTSKATSFQFDNQQTLPRNTTSLINVIYNHLVMLDGKHISLLNQAKDVVTNSSEMGGVESDILEKVTSCKEYEKAFKRYVKLTPNSRQLKIDHIVSAVILYYSDFSRYYSIFDHAMNDQKNIDPTAQKGFNLFMGKAQCGTCHFVPQFNGVKPPFLSSEFEVLGIPVDTAYSMLSPDKGREMINPAKETLHAFRTGTVRNTPHTAPYMHNGVFKTLDQVIDFYDKGGGMGRGLHVPNQTLRADSLKLTRQEKDQLLSFIRSLDENILFDAPPDKLPASKNKLLNTRKVGGEF